MMAAAVALRSVPAVSDSIRIGCGAGYSGDRIEPAVELAEKGALDYLVFECLAERTIALAQQRKAQRSARPATIRCSSSGCAAVLPACAANGRHDHHQHGRGQSAGRGRRGARRGARARPQRPAGRGGDRRRRARRGHRAAAARSTRPASPSSRLGDALVSANAYIGAEPIVDALAQGARRGRHRPRRRSVAVRRAARGTRSAGPPTPGQLIGRGDARRPPARVRRAGDGRLLRRSGPERRRRPGAARLPARRGRRATGRAAITKVPGSGGAVTVGDLQGAAALRDWRSRRLRHARRRRRLLPASGWRGRRRPRPRRRRRPGVRRRRLLKVSLGYRDGFIGEGQISYAGSGAVGAGAAGRRRSSRSGCG